MKRVKFFLMVAFLAFGCQSQEDIADLDGGLLGIDEFDTSHLAKDPPPSPHEFLIKETASVEGADVLNLY